MKDFLTRINNPSLAAFALGCFIALAWYSLQRADVMVDARSPQQQAIDAAFYVRAGADTQPDYLTLLTRGRK